MCRALVFAVPRVEGPHPPEADAVTRSLTRALFFLLFSSPLFPFTQGEDIRKAEEEAERKKKEERARERKAATATK